MAESSRSSRVSDGDSLESCSIERGGLNTLAPSGYSLKKARTSFRFASSKLSLAHNPVKDQRREDGDEEDSLIPDRHYQSSEQNVSDEEMPLEFRKREAASTSELFYDLWFVANLNVFASVHPITELNTLITFMGFFMLLWNTWFITTVHDARFGQDGVLERIARASHLTVMIGFAVVGVTFDQEQIVPPIFKATSLFLMMSRIVLAAQYSLVLFHARHHRRGRTALMFAVGLHLLPAIGYLVAAFAVTKHRDNHLLLIWYILGFFEMATILIHATFSKTLSFEGTHFNERLNLLTLIILGEGVIILAGNIGKIVEYTYVQEISRHWSPALVGILICAGALLYIIFQLYFDWMHHHHHMKTTHQAYWTIIHLPFHVALVLLAEGGSQWGIWWRAMESFKAAESQLHEAVNEAMEQLSSSAVADALITTAREILNKYGSTVDEGGEDARNLLRAKNNINDIPDDFWGESWSDNNDPTLMVWGQNYYGVSGTVMNAIADAFELSVPVDESSMDDNGFQIPELRALAMTSNRLELIFVYMYISAGVVLILLMLMAIVSKRRGWSIFNIFRTALVFTIGVGLALVSIISTNPTLAANYLTTPWPLPTITICFFTVLIITHLPHPPRIVMRRPESPDVEMGKVSGEAKREEPSENPEENAGTEYLGHGQEQNVLHRQNTAALEHLHAQLPSHYDVGRQNESEPGRVRQGTTLRRSLTMIQRAARNIHIETGGYDPVAEGDLFAQSASSPLRTNNLYSV